MKKLILPLAVILIFTFCLCFGKNAVNSIILKDTSVEYKEDALSESVVTLKKGDFVVLGEYLDEPIVWQVADVEDSKVLLQTKHIICFKSFDAANGDESDTGKFGSSDFKTSSLFKWLNSKGTVNYGENIPDDSRVFKGKNSYENEKGFLSSLSDLQLEAVSDEGVFLLSKEQISKYFSPSQRIKTATKSALLSDESAYINTSSKGIWYWTSTPSQTNNTSVATVTSSGGFYRSSAYDSATGVAPSLYLKSERLISLWGNGSEEKPYVIKGEVR